jgi:nucleoside-diphosphate-sugar epimerase
LHSTTDRGIRVEALVKVMAKEGLKGEVVNVGNSREVTILELAELIKRLTGSRSAGGPRWSTALSGGPR